MGATVMNILANHDPNRLIYASDENQRQNQQSQANVALTQQQTSQEAIKTKLLQQGLNDQNVMRSVFTDPTLQGSDGALDPNKSFGEFLKRGGSAQGALQLQTHFLDMRKKAADLTKDENANYATNLTNVGQTLGEIQALPQEQRGTALQNAMPALKRWEPDYDWSKMSTDDASLLGHKGVATYAAGMHAKQAETDLKGAQAGEAEQKTATAKREQGIQDLSSVTDAPSFSQWQERNPRLAKELPSTYTPAAIAAKVRSTVASKDQPEFDLKTAQATALKAFQAQDPKQVDDLVDAIVPPKDPMNGSTKILLRSAAARGATMQEINGIVKDAYDQRGRVQVAKENAQNKMQINLGGLLGGAGGGPSSLAKSVAEYEIPFSQAIARLPGPARESLMGEVKQLNPEFHSEYYNTFQKTENDATTGKIGTNANALNTMMGHLSVLNSAADALKNGDIQALNRVANFIGVQAGQAPVTTYNTIVHRLGPEVTKAYLASGGSVGERGTNEEDFDAKLGPDQIKQNIGVSALLADSKIKALQDQYSRGTYSRGKQKLISDEAEQARQSLTRQAPTNLQGATAPPAPKSIPAGAQVKYSLSTKSHYYSTDGGRTWQQAQP